MAMFAMSSAWILYDRARSVTGAAQQIGSWISLLLADSDTHVRQLLEALGKRVDAVAPTLNFCMLWAQEKGTCISDVVFQSRDTLFRVEKFIHSCTQAANHAKTHDKEYMLRELKAHLRELEFSISSMTLAISLINASRPYQPTTTYLDSTLSPSALLRASERLRSMSDAGGDVTSSFGSFYKANVTSNDTGACVWKRIWSSAAIKIYRNAARQLYELHVEDAKTIPVTSTTTTPSAHLTFDLDGSIDFRSSSSQALGIQFIKDVTQEKLMTVVDVSFTWVEQIANQIQSRYAFCLHDIGHQSTGLVDSLRPLDIAYIARLCVYENMCQAHQRVEKKAKPVLAHTVATDEELWLLFSACSSSCLTSSTATSSTSSTSTSTSSTSATSVASISTSTSTPAIPSHSQSQSQSSQSQSHPQPPFANIIRSFSVPSTPAFPSTSSQPPFPSTSTTISTSTTDPTASFVYSDDGEPLPIRYRPSIDSDIDDEHHHIKDEAFTKSIHAAMSSTLAESIHETSQHIQSSFQSKYASQHQLSSQPSSQHQPSSDWPDLDIDVGVTDVSYTDQSEQESLL